MAEVQFTRRAKVDLNEIDEFTEGEWGLAQADIYLSKIHSYLELLSETPLMGRQWKDSGTRLRRSEHGSHVIFYRATPKGILVCRILHRMLPPRSWR